MRREKFILKVYRRIFLIYGLQLDSSTRKYEKYYQCVCSVFYLVLILPQLMALSTVDHFGYRLNIFSQATMTASAFVHITWFAFVREEVITFHDFVLHNRRIFDDRFFDDFECKLRSQSKSLLSKVLPLVVLNIAIPIIIWTLSYSEGVNHQYYFYFQSVYPWDTDSTGTYLLTLILQTPIIHGMSLFIAALFTLCYCHTFFLCMHTRLKSLIREVDAREYSPRSKERDTELQSLHDLGRIISYHRLMSK